jgi:predicted ATPase
MLTQIAIENYRSCSDTRAHFRTPVSALVGPNGVGKSNLLQSIQYVAKAAVQNPSIDFADFFERPCVLTASLRLGDSSYVFRLSIVALDRGGIRLSESLSQTDGTGRTELVFERDGEFIKSPLLVGDASLAVGGLTSAMRGILSLLPSDHPLLLAVSPVADFFSTASYYTLAERTDATRNYVSEAQYQHFRKGLNAGADPVTSVALRLLHMWKEDREQLNELRAIVGPDGLGLVSIEDVVTAQFASTPKPNSSSGGGDPDILHIFRFTPLEGMGGAGRGLNFTQLSSGTQRAIRILTSMLFDQRSLMLLEEPEVSIHPGLLRRLIDLIRSYSSRTQIIFSTHSGYVLDMLHPDEINLVGAVDGNTQVRPFTAVEATAAEKFLRDEGPLSEFVETLDPEAK